MSPLTHWKAARLPAISEHMPTSISTTWPPHRVRTASCKQPPPCIGAMHHLHAYTRTACAAGLRPPHCPARTTHAPAWHAHSRGVTPPGRRRGSARAGHVLSAATCMQGESAADAHAWPPHAAVHIWYDGMHICV